MKHPLTKILTNKPDEMVQVVYYKKLSFLVKFAVNLFNSQTSTYPRVAAD